MSALVHEPRPSLRVIAFASKNVHHLRTVNIKASNSKTLDPHNAIHEYVQLTPAQMVKGIHETVMDSGGQIKGLPTIYVNGYTAPN